VLLDSTAPLISPVFPDSVFEQTTITLRPGQSLLLYTDGIVEAQADSQEFGLSGILSRVPRQGDGDGSPGRDAGRDPRGRAARTWATVPPPTT
jgi:hypothetical protein